MGFHGVPRNPTGSHGMALLFTVFIASYLQSATFYFYLSTAYAVQYREELAFAHSFAIFVFPWLSSCFHSLLDE